MFSFDSWLDSFAILVVLCSVLGTLLAGQEQVDIAIADLCRSLDYSYSIAPHAWGTQGLVTVCNISVKLGCYCW